MALLIGNYFYWHFNEHYFWVKTLLKVLKIALKRALLGLQNLTHVVGKLRKLLDMWENMKQGDNTELSVALVEAQFVLIR